MSPEANPVKELIKNKYEHCQKELMNVVEQAWENDHQAAQQKKYIDKKEWEKHAIEGSITWNRASALAEFIYSARPNHILEVGSFLGMSSNFFMSIISEWEGRLTSIDPNVRHRVFDNPRQFYKEVNNKWLDKITIIDAFWMNNTSIESGWWDYQNREPKKDLNQINAIISNIPVINDSNLSSYISNEIDMAFIDGAHDYDSVISDFIGLSRIIKDGGAVIFDDVDEYWPETYRAVCTINKTANKLGLGDIFFKQQTAMYVDRGLFADIRKGLINL